MKTITKTIKVYEFSELLEASKMRAINDYINCIVDNVHYNDMTENMRKACDKANAMQTPWFIKEYIYTYCLNEIKDIFENFYFLDGGIIFED